MRLATAGLLACALAGCGGAASSPVGDDGGSAKVTVSGKTFDVSRVVLSYETGEGGYFRVEGDDAAHRDDDCLPGLGGGIALYGDMPADVKSLTDLAGRELPFEFTGDGDDFNLCFVGTDGLLGVERGTVRFDSVDGTRVAFAFSGSFIQYDGEGAQSEAAIDGSGTGTAHVID